MALLKKKFFEIELPIVGQKAELIAMEESELNGKTIKLDLTRKLRGKSIEVKFLIKYEDEKLFAIPTRLILLSYYIRRMMRKSSSYVEDSFSYQCKDSKIKIKPFLITRKKVSRAVKNALRRETRKEIEIMFKDKTFSDIVSDIVMNKIQKDLSIKLKKIYPLALCEIREVFIEKESEYQEKAIKQNKEKEEKSVETKKEVQKETIKKPKKEKAEEIVEVKEEEIDKEEKE